MITHVPSNPTNDYAVMKVLAQLRRNAAAGQVRRLSSGLDLSRMSPGEVLYVAGHGVMGSYGLSGMSTSTLLAILNNKTRGLPLHCGGVVILTCFSAIPPGGGAGGGVGRLLNRFGGGSGGGSVIEQVARGLTHKHIPVTGTCGFAFGSPLTEGRQQASVLPPSEDQSYPAVYNGGAIQVYRWLRELVAPRPMRIAGVTIGRGERVADKVSDQALTQWAEQFVRRRNQLEARMKELVAAAQRSSVAGSVDALHRNREFQELVRQQYNLHAEAGLFLSQRESHRTLRGDGAQA